jgi:hypothetical protein
LLLAEYPDPDLTDGQIDDTADFSDIADPEQRAFELSMIPSGFLYNLADC